MKTHAPDYIFIALVGLLVFGGLIVLASASSVLGAEKFGDPNYYVKHQMSGGLIAGLVGFIFFAWFDYRWLRKVSFPLLILTVFALAAVFIPGIGIRSGGAARWVGFGGFSFQPAELAKLSFLIYLAAWLSARAKGIGDWRRLLLPFLALAGGVGALIALEPATGTLIILMAATFVTVFLARIPWWQLAFLVLVGVAGLLMLIQLSPYRFERILAFIEPELDPQGSGYQSRQAAIAIASGGFFGMGLGNSHQKYLYLPEPIGDSIFAILMEEFGMIGGAAFLTLLLGIGARAFRIGKHAPDDFGRLLACALSSVLLIQAFMNMAAISGLMPITGVPLPLVSYGGTSFATFLSAMGIVTGVSRYTK